MARLTFAIGTALILILVASAATLAHHLPGHSRGRGDSNATVESQSLKLDPGGSLQIECDTELTVEDDGGTLRVRCEPEPEPTPSPEPTEEPTEEPAPQPDPTPGTGPLVTGYEFTTGDQQNFDYIEGGFISGLEQDAPHGVRTVRDAGPYDGWDVLLTDQHGSTRTLATDSWITLELSRPATIAVVWQAYEPLPAWLDGWNNVGSPVVIEDSQSPKPRQVLEQTFDAGEVALGGVYSSSEGGESRSPYLVVINETDAIAPPDDDGDEQHDDDHGSDDGQSDDGHDDGHNDDDQHDDDGHGHDGSNGGSDDFSSAPPWSAPPMELVDQSTLEQPVAGQTCPDWVAKKYVTQGHDGLWYLTWHPAVDPEFNCHFGYEHGSNPERVPGARSPAFAYGTPGHIHESFYGFKVKAFDNGDGIKMLNTTHFGTAEPHLAACQQFHWNNFQFIQGGELVADLYIMGDFGAARKNDTDEPLDRQCIHQRTGELTDQHQLSRESNGVRLNPVCTGPSTSDCAPFYYPWRMSTPGASEVMGFNSAAYTVNTPTVVSACEDMRCESSRHIGGTGAWAFAAFRTGFGVRDPGHSSDGVFYTNSYGDTLLSPDDPNAVRQYIKPGTNIQLASLGDNHSWFPDRRHGGTHGDYMFTQMRNGDPNIADNHRAAVDPNGIIGNPN